MEPSLAGCSCGDAGPSPAASPPVACVYSSVTAPHPLEQGPAWPHRMPTSRLTIPCPGHSHRAAPDSKGGWWTSTAHAPKERKPVVGEWEVVSAAGVSYQLRSAGAGGWGWEIKSGVSRFPEWRRPGPPESGHLGQVLLGSSMCLSPPPPRSPARSPAHLQRATWGKLPHPTASCFLGDPASSQRRRGSGPHGEGRGGSSEAVRREEKGGGAKAATTCS